MFFNGNYYYLILILEVFCAIHSYRRGTLNRWIWLIVFIPVIGCLIYLYSEVFSNRGNVGTQFKSTTVNISDKLNPSGKIKKLEEELRFTNTFANKVKLADAYLSAGDTEKAIELYTSSLTGAFDENEYVMAQLIVAYYEQGHYNEVIPLAKKLYKLPQFARSRSHILYAMALENTGHPELADAEFKLMKGRYSYFEARYQYGLFLIRQDRIEDAYDLFNEMLDEEKHLGPVERKANRIWLSKVKDELRKIT